MPVRLTAFDIDGTLIDSPKKSSISKAVKSALLKIHRAGVRICFATARPYQLTKDVAEDIGVDDSIIICCNGAQIVVRGKTVWGMPIEPEYIQNIIGMTESLKSELVIMTDAPYSYKPYGYTLRNFAALIEHVISREELGQILKDDVPVYQIVLSANDHTDSEEFRKKAEEALTVYREELDYVWQASAECMVISRNGVNKGTALEIIGRYLGISREETMAAGDDGVDIPMLAYAGIGVAMGNATEEVKAVADVIVPPVWEDGICEILDQYILK